ncbi:hhH-GPD superfamily base excision DNA repair protein [Hirsutella rhossiliensis]|uniref:HhH-GPD superfamily base excision DNA repair protein n=1 Tax=Hirsutella rhossiliensis TaxID=111463 RepID=A0A9P8N2K5_9HYPO|nr:hhH-GPD superfamily base excision DNA repair protein [Hirsutella rhossiliensis]KAH0964694.1 hhH-GPD superfamily base excision DNA repair protein [Hirsutella rhossiliensis]
MAAASSAQPRPRRSARNLKRGNDIKKEESPDESAGELLKATAPAKRARKRVKTEASLPPPKDEDVDTPLTADDSDDKRDNTSGPQKTPAKTAQDRAAHLQARKLKSFSAYASQSPFRHMARPTPQECRLAHGILARLHGDRVRPDTVVAPTGAAGCGNSPSVLDALVRTILSQNTSDRNSSRAKRSMDDVYGGSDRWDAIVDGGQPRLQKAIQSGGLSVVKSKAIMGILQQAKARYGVYSLDHLFGASDDDAMREMLSFQGVGPKTASCVLLFCLRRASFAVDTHVYRITGLLGWRPPAASREEAQAHLDARVPPEEKYPLHVLLISHGKKCAECRAGGKNLGQCELRKAFRRGKLEGEAGEDMKEEEMKAVKQEDGQGE